MFTHLWNTKSGSKRHRSSDLTNSWTRPGSRIQPPLPSMNPPGSNLQLPLPNIGHCNTTATNAVVSVSWSSSCHCPTLAIATDENRAPGAYPDAQFGICARKSMFAAKLPRVAKHPHGHGSARRKNLRRFVPSQQEIAGDARSTLEVR